MSCIHFQNTGHLNPCLYDKKPRQILPRHFHKGKISNGGNFQGIPSSVGHLPLLCCSQYNYYSLGYETREQMSKGVIKQWTNVLHSFPTGCQDCNELTLNEVNAKSSGEFRSAQYDAIVLMRFRGAPFKLRLKDVMKKAAFVELCNNVSMTLQVSVSFLRLPILLSNLKSLIGKV